MASSEALCLPSAVLVVEASPRDPEAPSSLHPYLLSPRQSQGRPYRPCSRCGVPIVYSKDHLIGDKRRNRAIERRLGAQARFPSIAAAQTRHAESLQSAETRTCRPSYRRPSLYDNLSLTTHPTVGPRTSRRQFHPNKSLFLWGIHPGNLLQTTEKRTQTSPAPPPDPTQHASSRHPPSPPPRP